MRIISGEHRGLKLCEFEGEDVRPTSDRARESIYDIIGYMVPGCSVLDLFCGTGSFGLEAISRGAEKVVFNDNSKDSLALLKKNIARFKKPIPAEVKNLDYVECLASCHRQFDIIFIDPPYRLDIGINALKLVVKKKVLAENGVAIYERNVPFEGEIPGLVKTDERKYGKAYITFFRRAEDVAKDTADAAAGSADDAAAD